MTSRGVTGRSRLLGGALLLTAALAGCEDGGFALPGKTADTDAPSTTTRLVERDIEVPEVFQVSEAGLWDGRPSLGGVWVAYPGVKDPERVIIRNEDNQKFVIGALFRRERENPGPQVQVSSDAADALGMLAGQPARLNITALRRDEVGEPGADAEAPQDTTAILSEPEAIASSSLDIPSGADTPAPATPPSTSVAAAPKPAPAPATAKPASSLSKPFIQIGIFSVEQNARNTATSMRNIGVTPVVKQQSASGKTFWRVIVGPAGSAAERDTLLAKVKDLGFTDAYFVSD